MAEGGKSQRAEQSRRAAAALRRRGYYHGKRASVTHAPPVPNPKDVGSAKYRRLQKAG